MTDLEIIAVGIIVWLAFLALGLALCKIRRSDLDTPICYGDYPDNAQHRAEYCCHACPFNFACHSIARERHGDV